MRTCVVDLLTSKVINVVEMGKQPDSATVTENKVAPNGQLYIPSEVAQIGWAVSPLGQFIVPIVPAVVGPIMPPSPRQWLERLSPAAQVAIMKAALADASGQLLLWLFKGTGNTVIDVTHPETQQGVGALVTAGVLSQADATTLLAP